MQTAYEAYDECFNRTSFGIWVKGTQILAIEAVFAKVTIMLAPVYVPTANQLLLGPSWMFTALWDRSEYASSCRSFSAKEPLIIRLLYRK